MSLTALLGAAIYEGAVLHKDKALLCEDDLIVGLKDPETLPASCEVRHLDGGYLTPGFVDLQSLIYGVSEQLAYALVERA